MKLIISINLVLLLSFNQVCSQSVFNKIQNELRDSINLSFGNNSSEEKEPSSAPYSFSSQLGCCENLIICGDEFDNSPSRIKHFDGFTYYIGSTFSNGQSVATFTKLNGDNEVVWEYKLDGASQLADFVKTDDNAFLLVGRTLPVQSDNRSILARINEDGTLGFIRSYQNVAREALFRIVKQENPLDPDYPYYMGGFENPGPTVSATDEVHLHNLDAQGNIKWSVELDYTFDDQFARGLLALQNGHLALFGDYAPNNRGVVVTVDGLSGMILSSARSSSVAVFREAVQLNNGNIAIAGRMGLTNSQALLTILDSDLNFISSLSVSNQGVVDFTELKKNNNNELFTVGRTSGGLPIICKAEINAGQINITDFKYIDNGETSFTAPSIDVVGSSIYYSDGRTGHPFSYGGNDVLVGYFDTDFSGDCLSDTMFSSTNQNYSMTAISPTSTLFTAPSPTEDLSLVEQAVNCQPLGNAEKVLDLGPDINACTSEEITLHAGEGFESYLWNDLTTDSIYTTLEAGVHHVEAIDLCGRVYQDTVIITIEENNIDLGDDITLCYNQDTSLTIEGAYEAIQWFPSDQVSCDTCMITSVVIENEETFIVQGITENCVFYDTIIIEQILPEFDTMSVTSCIGDTVLFFGLSIEATGVYENLSDDCLNYDVLEVTFVSPDTTMQIEQICASDSILFDGQYINAQGVYEMNTINELGCDSTIMLQLEVVNELEAFETFHICDNDSIQVFGQWIYVDSVLQETYISSLGCDSIHTVSVLVNPIPTNEVQLEFCEGDSIFIYGNWYKDDGFYETFVTNNSGCDSLIFLELIRRENVTNYDTIMACQGDTVFLLSQSITEESDIFETNNAINGCDSLIYFHIGFYPLVETYEELVLCTGDSILINNEWTQDEGMFEALYTSDIGCDSIHHISIQFIPDPPTPEINIDCEDLVILVSIDPQAVWQPVWSNGDTSFESIYFNGETETSLTLYAEPNCEKQFEITLPQLPNFSEIPTITDTMIVEDASILVDLGLDTAEWTVVWNDDSIINCVTCMQVEITPTEDSEITIYLLHESGCMFESTFIIRIKEAEENIYIPNVFSPNSDNLNDEWIVFPSENLEVKTCAIYDRWGNLVYYSVDDLPTWDGKLNGKNCQAGVYAYLVEYTTSDGQQKIDKGSLTIMR